MHSPRKGMGVGSGAPHVARIEIISYLFPQGQSLCCVFLKVEIETKKKKGKKRKNHSKNLTGICLMSEIRQNDIKVTVSMQPQSTLKDDNSLRLNIK